MPAEAANWTDDEYGLIDTVSAHLAIAMVQVESYDRLTELSQTDELTGLLNRRAFVDELKHRLSLLDREGRTGVLLYLDLDNFKPINDRFGHHVGDQVLRDVAEILQRESRSGDLVARLGGDEFAMWLDGAGLDGAEPKATRLVGAIQKVTDGNGLPPLGLNASVGVVVTSPNVARVDDLLVRADTAMYRAKALGKGRHVVAEDRETEENQTVAKEVG